MVKCVKISQPTNPEKAHLSPRFCICHVRCPPPYGLARLCVCTVHRIALHCTHYHLIIRGAFCRATRAAIGVVALNGNVSYKNELMVALGSTTPTPYPPKFPTRGRTFLDRAGLGQVFYALLDATPRFSFFESLGGKSCGGKGDGVGLQHVHPRSDSLRPPYFGHRLAADFVTIGYWTPIVLQYSRYRLSNHGFWKISSGWERVCVGRLAAQVRKL